MYTLSKSLQNHNPKLASNKACNINKTVNQVYLGLAVKAIEMQVQTNNLFNTGNT